MLPLLMRNLKKSLHLLAVSKSLKMVWLHLSCLKGVVVPVHFISLGQPGSFPSFFSLPRLGWL